MSLRRHLAKALKDKVPFAFWIKAEYESHKVPGLSVNGPIVFADKDKEADGFALNVVYITPLEAFVMAHRLEEAAMSAVARAAEDGLEKLFPKGVLHGPNESKRAVSKRRKRRRN